MNIGGLVVVNLDNVNYVAPSPREPNRLEIHFGNEVVNIDKLSMEDITSILNALPGKARDVGA
jgi:hypothetical protein